MATAARDALPLDDLWQHDAAEGARGVKLHELLHADLRRLLRHHGVADAAPAALQLEDRWRYGVAGVARDVLSLCILHEDIL